jgi:hypothetical protein
MVLIRNIANLPWMIEVDAGTYKEGMVVKEGTAGNRAALITVKGDSAIGIISESQKDPKTLAHEAAVAGDKRNYYPLGCKAIVKVYAVTTKTFSPGAPIYLDDAVDGGVTPDAATSRPIGHYPRNMAAQTTVATGELVPLYLDVEPGATLV